MTVKQQEICNIIETLPEELANKVMDYIEYLKFTTLTNQAPDSVIVKNEDDLREKLEKGIQASDKGETCPIDEAFDKIEKMFVS